MIHKPVTFLYLPNELPEGGQIGPRRAISALQQEGRISSLTVFPFPVKEQALGVEGACRELLAIVERLRPNIILWQHIGKFAIDAEFITRLRTASPASLLAYHESDGFSRKLKRYSRSARLLMRAADVFFHTALGPAQQLSEEIGAQRIYWCPSTYDRERFGAPPPPEDVRRPYDAVMIGNVVRPIPRLRELEGATERLMLGRRLAKLFGPRFALYGNGWNGLPANQGPLAYADQHRAIHQAWVSVAWDHYPSHSYYFSDRLPIALAAGVPHVCGYHAGYEVLFRGCDGLITAKTVQEAVDGVIYFLSLGRQQLQELGLQCREFALRHFEAGVVFGQIFEKCLEALEERQAGAMHTHA